MRMLVSRTTRIQLFRIAFAAPFRTHLTHGIVNQALHFAWLSIGILFLDALHHTVEDAPANGLFDELGEVSLFHPLRTKVGAEGEISFFGNFDIPANGVVFHKESFAHLSR